MSKRRFARGGIVRPVEGFEELDSTLLTQDSLASGTFASWRSNSRVNYQSHQLTYSQTATTSVNSIQTASSSSSSSSSSASSRSSALTGCSVCVENSSSSPNSALSAFCSLPTEILETIFGLLPIEDRISFYEVLSRGRYLRTKARKALSSSSIWRRVNLIARRPDHLVTRIPDASELVCSEARSPSIRLKEQFLRLFPLTSTNRFPSPSPLDIKILALKKHSFELSFDFFLAALINRGVCPAIRRLTFAVEEVWHPDFYPLQRSDMALDRISQLISELGTECREINVVKWPRLQDDTIIDRTYSEMQAHYASSEASTTDPILAIITNVFLFANLEVLGIFWFDFEDPEFWAMARSDWCLMSHQWIWSEEEFSSGHSLYPTQANREFNLFDNFCDNLKELRVTFSAYSDDRYFLDPVFVSVGALRRLRVMIRASWNGWDGLQSEPRPIGAYWSSLMARVPLLKVTLTFIEFFDFTKFSSPELIFHPRIPVECCQWLPGAVLTLSVLTTVGRTYAASLVSLDVHSELIDDRGRNGFHCLLSDLIKVLRICRSLKRFVFDSSVTRHFCKVVARMRKSEWKQLVFFSDRIRELVETHTERWKEPIEMNANGSVSAFEMGVGKIIGRKWKFHDNEDREYGPRGYRG